MESPIDIQVRDRVAWITLNRPPHNSMNEAMLDALIAAAADLRLDPTLVAAVIQGAGEKAFCAGGDIKWMANQDSDSWHRIAHGGIHAAINAISTLPFPVIAAVHGYALGGGFEFALACDWIVASESAVFGLPEVQLGVFPGGGGTQRLPRSISAGMARRLIMTGVRIDARQAAALGIVVEVAPVEHLLDAVELDLERLRSLDSHVLAETKRVVSDGLEMPLAQALRFEADLVSLLFGRKEQNARFNDFVERKQTH